MATNRNFHFNCDNPKKNFSFPFSFFRRLLRVTPLDLMNAATKIQASFRGHMARKQAEKQSKNDSEITKEMEKLQSKVNSTYSFSVVT